MARLGGRPGPQCRRWRSGCQASVSFVTMLGSCTPVVTYCSSAASTPAPCHTRGSLLGSSFSSIECRTVGPNTPVHRGRKVDMLQLLTHRFVSFFWEGVTSVKQLCPWSSNAIGRNARGVEFFMGHRQATWKSGVPVLMAWFGGEHEHRTRLTCRIFLVWNWGKIPGFSAELWISTLSESTAVLFCFAEMDRFTVHTNVHISSVRFSEWEGALCVRGERNASMLALLLVLLGCASRCGLSFTISKRSKRSRCGRSW